MHLNWKHIGRDVAIIFILTAIGGFIIGMVNAFSGGPLSIVWLAVSNLIFGSAGFAYSAYKVSAHRWAHLVAVAIGVWILSLMNPLLGLTTFTDWLFGIIAILLFMGIGGGIGIALARRNR